MSDYEAGHDAGYEVGYEAGAETGYENGHDTGRLGGLDDGWSMALDRVLERAETYFKVDPASRRLVAALVAKVREEGR